MALGGAEIFPVWVAYEASLDKEADVHHSNRFGATAAVNGWFGLRAQPVARALLITSVRSTDAIVCFSDCRACVPDSKAPSGN